MVRQATQTRARFESRGEGVFSPSSGLLLPLEGLVHGLPRQAHHPCDGGDRLALGVKLADQGLLLLGELDVCTLGEIMIVDVVRVDGQARVG